MPNFPDILEALLFASERPVPLEKLAAILEISPASVEAELSALCDEKNAVGALQLVEVAGGWQFVTKSEFAPFVRRLKDEKKSKLSRAAFEVLAIVAYRQPVTRADIDTLRGVESAGPLHFLLERKLLVPSARKDAPGRPWLYTTTPRFLEQFGLKSLEDLPELDEFAALEGVGHEAQTLNLFERPA
ncbi:condensin subunit ScpB [Abditibacterium utsteinense]|uniref:Condensin subunit ScpB n=1 Tax=Abditibacterium utsteinense TaxID=1960156 RepID=A0A2S8SW48_9BACT|nr:SMC-Scp complex subunit ScpB [Abditibacterium utsteinense]PQV65014.1 condensin subunit ScpB [Abditibacterium utsteinense]